LLEKVRRIAKLVPNGIGGKGSKPRRRKKKILTGWRGGRTRDGSSRD